MLLDAASAKLLSSHILSPKTDFLSFVGALIMFNSLNHNFKTCALIPKELDYNKQFYINTLQNNGYNVELEENWLYISW